MKVYMNRKSLIPISYLKMLSRQVIKYQTAHILQVNCWKSNMLKDKLLTLISAEPYVNAIEQQF